MDQIKAIGLEPLAATNANGDPGKQSSDVKNLIAAGANALIINPADSEAIIPVVKFANEKNVPVVMIDIAPSGGKLAMIVRANNKEFGQKACEASYVRAKAHGCCFGAGGPPTTTTAASAN